MGPNHRKSLRGMALSPADIWETPFGPLRVDTAARDRIARQSDVSVDAAPFSDEHSLEVHLPFIHRALGEVEIVPVLVGQTPKDAVAKMLDMLWGGPETAIVVSSDLSHYHDYATCQTKDEQTAMAIERLDAWGCDGDRACGRCSIHGLLDQAKRRDLRATAIDIRNSGDMRGARDRVVGYGAFAFEYAHSAQLDAALRQLLIRLAREVVRQSVHNPGTAMGVKFRGAVPRVLRAQRATFVTLKVKDRLRGFHGSLAPERSLLDDVVENARQAVLNDSRFPRLTPDELGEVHCHVSILSTPRSILAQSEAELAAALRPDIDGLIMREGAKQGLFLPSVWESIPDPLSFVRALKHRCGLPPDYWPPTVQAFRFVTESFGDDTAN
jgi:AmmeMemoRadiSam system protein A